MYSGFSKNNGSVIGDTSMAVQVDMGEAGESTAAEESLICMNENGEELVLNARIDPASGDLAWCQLYSKDEIMERTVGMSQMTSMLRDTDRNSVYERAIGVLIQNFVNEHARQPVVLDVGCGTGLLSMLAVRQGAEFVIGCEMFTTMASIAERVVGANDLDDKILVVNAKSSKVEDLPVQPDLLISELLDSALLGEGCMPAHADVISRLLNLSPGSTGMEDGEADFANRVLPYSGLVHATLVQSAEVRDMHDVQSIALGKGLHMHRTPIEETDASSVCLGGRHLVPVHWAQLKHRGATEISDSVQLLHANFTQTAVDATTGIAFAQPDAWQYSDIAATEDGTVHGVLLHWTLYLLSPALDPQRQCTYCTAPGAQNWQDHWQQTVYPLPCPIDVHRGEVVRVYAMHDGVTIHLHAEKVEADTADAAAPEAKRPRCDAQHSGSPQSQQEQTVLCGEDGPGLLYDECRTLCRCGWHVLCGAERFQAMCDTHRGEAWTAALDSLVATLPESGVVMDVGDGSLLGLSVASKLQRRGIAEGSDSAQAQWSVVCRETKQFSRLFFSQLADANSLENALVWDGAEVSEVADFINRTETEAPGSEDDDQNEANVDLTVLAGSVKAVISECSYYQLTALPAWQALAFYFQVRSLREQGLLHADCRVLPGKALLRAVALELPQLRNCHGLANTVCGFDHAELDAQQQLWHTHMYPYKLSAYEYAALTEATTLGVLDYTAIPSGSTSSSTTDGEADLMSGEVITANLEIHRAGQCDAVAIWVDYELTPGNYLRSYKDGRFAHHLTANIKFFPTPCRVEAGQTVRGRAVLNPVKMDFDYEFVFV